MQNLLRKNFRLVFLPYASSRLLILMVSVLVHCTSVTESGQDQNWLLRHPALAMTWNCSVEALKDFSSRGDAAWYKSIAEGGYAELPFSLQGQQNWAFFPLHPIFIRAGLIFGFHPNIAGIISSHIWFFLGLVFLTELARKRGLDSQLISRALWLLCLYPFSVFFSASLTEAPFFALTTGFLLAFECGYFSFALLTYALLCVTRLTGVLLLPVAIMEGYRMWNRYPPPNKRELSLRTFSCVLPVFFFTAFMAHLYIKTGNALAFYHIHAAWRSPPSFSRFLNEIRATVLDWNFVWLNIGAVLTSLTVTISLVKKRQWSDALICAVPISVGFATSGTVLSLGRFTIVQFPIFLLLAAVLKNADYERSVLALFAFFLCLMTAGNALHITASLT